MAFVQQTLEELEIVRFATSAKVEENIAGEGGIELGKSKPHINNEIGGRIGPRELMGEGWD